jgi:hypothetical protein
MSMFVTLSLDESFGIGKTAIVNLRRIEFAYESKGHVVVVVAGEKFYTTYTMEYLLEMMGVEKESI